MRITAILLCAALTASAARSQTLTQADRETLLENLAKIRETADAKIDSRFRVAIAAYREAMNTDETAIEFYLKCTEKVNFEDQQKKNSDFRDWKRKEADHLGDQAFRVALRYQLRWLVTTLKAASEKPDLPALAAEAQETVDMIFRDADKLKSQEQTLAQPVTSTVFAKAYEIGTLDKANWSLSPIRLEEVYGKIIFPPLHTPAKVEALRAAWIKRIQQEGTKVEAWGGGGGGGGNAGGRRNGPGQAPANGGGGTHSTEYERFQTETLPELQWQMEMDLFRSGDESGAALRMLAHIQKNITHHSARAWTEQFENLLKPKPAIDPPATAAVPTVP